MKSLQEPEPSQPLPLRLQAAITLVGLEGMRLFIPAPRPIGADELAAVGT